MREEPMHTAGVGVDFGTTNTSVAVADDHGSRALEIDPHNDAPTSLPSLLYMERNGDRVVGRQAAERYIERNTGRRVRARRIRINRMIPLVEGGEIDKEHMPREGLIDPETRYGVVASAVVEARPPGRFFHSLKPHLSNRQFVNTKVFGQPYQMEELVAFVLEPVRQSVETSLGRVPDVVIFGRPVMFPGAPEDDAFAQDRLATAARIAGFRDVVFFYEPVAACLEYAVTGRDRQRILVADIGGGTCDVCVMSFEAGEGVRSRLRNSRILSVAGVAVAGNAIDREILRSVVFPRLGSKAVYGPSRLPMPASLFESLLDWQQMYALNTEEILHWLAAAEASCDQPEALRALEQVIRRNLGYRLAREAEQAKKRLSMDPETVLSLLFEGLHVEERLDRDRFAHLIEEELAAIEACLVEAETRAETRPNDLDLVLATGGSSLVPAIRDLLVRRYGPERVVAREAFTSVATGLAIAARFLGA